MIATSRAIPRPTPKEGFSLLSSGREPSSTLRFVLSPGIKGDEKGVHRMSSHPFCGRWLLAPALLLAASVSASASARVHIAEDASAIIPVMNVSPQVFPIASDNTAILSVTNGNTANAGLLSTGDTFSFDFPDQGLNVGGSAQLTVNSPAISPFAWQVQVQNGGKCDLKYVGPSTQFGPRDLITCKLKLKTGTQQVQGQAQFDAPNNRH